jgi:hypothetical protein
LFLFRGPWTPGLRSPLVPRPIKGLVAGLRGPGTALAVAVAVAVAVGVAEAVAVAVAVGVAVAVAVAVAVFIQQFLLRGAIQCLISPSFRGK